MSILFILQELMGRIYQKKRVQEIPLPCDQFDLIIGTSTGGLIALMLGRLRMPVNETIDAYEALSKDVFGKGKKWRLNPLSSAPRYSAENLKNAIYTIAKDTPLVDPDPNACRAAVVAVKQVAANDPPDLLRTYSQLDAPANDCCTVSDAARATTAATTFFPPAVVQVNHGLSVTYLDGGLGNTNPADHAIKEAQKIWGPNCKFGCIVSIGTGLVENIDFKGDMLRLANKLKEIQSSGERVHTYILNEFGVEPSVYFRFNVPTNLRQIGLDEWRRRQQIGELTHSYIQRTSSQFRDCVNAILCPVSFLQLVDASAVFTFGSATAGHFQRFGPSRPGTELQ